MSDVDWKESRDRRVEKNARMKKRRAAYIYFDQVSYGFVSKKCDIPSDDFWRYYHTHPKYKYQIKTESTKGTNKGHNKDRSWWTIHFKMTDAKREIVYGDPYVKGRYKGNRCD